MLLLKIAACALQEPQTLHEAAKAGDIEAARKLLNEVQTKMCCINLLCAAYTCIPIYKEVVATHLCKLYILQQLYTVLKSANNVAFQDVHAYVEVRN